jgi:hypothetical protein
MSIQIKLFVDDLEFNVLEYDFDILQNADNTGLPNSRSTPQPFKPEFDIRIQKNKILEFVETFISGITN